MTADELRSAAVEHAMRLCDDEGLVVPFQHVDQLSLAARTAFGRLLWDASAAAAPRSPLTVFTAGGDVDPGWRTSLPTVDGNLWGELELLEQLYGHQCPAAPCRCDPLDRLYVARGSHGAG